MKKVLSFALVAILLVSALSVATFAAKPLASDFVPGTGFFLNDSNGAATTTRDVPEITAVSDGVQVKYGGYYTSGANCGGVITDQKINLNGFKVTVRLDNVPTYDNDDTWFAFDFLAAKRGFYVDNFTVDTGNTGIMNLIRPNKGTFSAMDSASWSIKKNITNDLFKFATGDVVTLTVNRTAVGNYTFTMEKTGIAAPLVVDYEYPVDDIFPDGQAYFSLIASSKYSQADDFKYTITDIANGTELTAADREAIEDAKLEADAEAKLEQANMRIDNAENLIKTAKERAEACGSEGALALIAKASTKLAEAKTAVESGTFTLENIKTICNDTIKFVNDANKLSKAAEEAATDTEAVTEAQTEAQSEAQSDPAPAEEKEGFPVWGIALIAGGAVVIVAVVVLLVVLRKKK